MNSYGLISIMDVLQDIIEKAPGPGDTLETTSKNRNTREMGLREAPLEGKNPGSPMH
jgi:hypothetical protein